MQKQFASFVSQYGFKDSIALEPQPPPISKDSYSKSNATLEYRQSPQPTSLNSSIIKLSSRKFSIPKTRSRNESITRGIINRDKLQNFTKLPEEGN